MSAIVEKQVQIADYRAKRLEQLAAERGVTENILIEEGLDLLFREQERQAAREEELQESWELLRQLEAESGPVQPSSRPVLKINPEDIVAFAGTPIDPDRIRRIGD